MSIAMRNSLKDPCGTFLKWISPVPIAARVAMAAVLSLALLICLNLHVGLQMAWGNVATWASSIASTAVVIMLALSNRAQAVASKLTAAQLRANGVRIRCVHKVDASPPHWLITIENRSKETIYRIKTSGIAVKTPEGEGVIAEKVWFKIDDSGTDGTLLDDGADFPYKAIAVDPGMVSTHHALPGVAWTASTGHRFRSVYPLVSGVPDLSASWEFVGMDPSIEPTDRVLRP
ncbi:hypothetical protein ACIP5Y_07500 [Nocardia sp. NPDC088792]|uniref:hypothetical protein n=1 Tax=Nocardia sp. NPDC088792 TaxID=3364332 RepID=UPI003822D487